MPKEILYVRVDHRVKVALSTLARQTVGEMSDHARVGIERYIESEMAALAVAAEHSNGDAARRLAELRAAYDASN